jgi:hypothetical protein
MRPKPCREGRKGREGKTKERFKHRRIVNDLIYVLMSYCCLIFFASLASFASLAAKLLNLRGEAVNPISS